MQAEVEKRDLIYNQVQGFIDSGLLVADADGVPQMNVDAVLNSEPQSEASQPQPMEQIQSLANRRQAREFHGVVNIDDEVGADDDTGIN